MQSADDIILALNLREHPEGGYFVETYRQKGVAGERAVSTAIYYLLREGQISAWHQIDASEVWHFYAGAPLELRIKKKSQPARHLILGCDLEKGHRPQVVVEPFEWQAARSLGPWTLVGCTVSPGFEFVGFTLASPGKRDAFVGQSPD